MKTLTKFVLIGSVFSLLPRTIRRNLLKNFVFPFGINQVLRRFNLSGGNMMGSTQGGMHNRGMGGMEPSAS